MTQDTDRVPATGREDRDTLAQAKLVGAVVAAAALLLFFLQNLQEVEIHFLLFDWTTQMIWALVVSAALGAVGVFFAMLVGRRQPRSRDRND